MKCICCKCLNNFPAARYLTEKTLERWWNAFNCDKKWMLFIFLWTIYFQPVKFPQFRPQSNLNRTIINENSANAIILMLLPEIHQPRSFPCAFISNTWLIKSELFMNLRRINFASGQLLRKGLCLVGATLIACLHLVWVTKIVFFSLYFRSILIQSTLAPALT